MPVKFTKTPPVTQCLSTNPKLPIILIRMKWFIRTLALILLAAFAAGTIAHAAGATTMAVNMALTASGAMNMGDCERCVSDGGDKKNAATCDIACVFPFSGTVSPEQAVHSQTAATASAFGLFDVAGRTGPPDPYPPRSPS